MACAEVAGRQGQGSRADAGNGRVQRFAANGAFLGSWGRLGSGAGELADPRGIAVGEACISPPGNPEFRDVDELLDVVERRRAEGDDIASAVQAAVAVLRLAQGPFTFRHGEFQPKVRIQQGTSYLLFEAMRLADEQA